MKRQHAASIGLMLIMALAVSCGKKTYSVPEQYAQAEDGLVIFPDYRNVVIPCNIAPLDFMVRSGGETFVVEMKNGGGQLVAGGGKDGKIYFEASEWSRLLESAKGKDIAVTVYAEKENGWVAYPSYTVTVAEEPIDSFVSYRLIEPSYEFYRQLGLYQRNLTNYDVRTIYENNRRYNADENHCVNCHNYQNYRTENMLFHVRGKMGGTILSLDGKVDKLNMKCDSVLSNSVYPSWHPDRPWIVFSSNRTGQTFHTLNAEKVEVVDYGSDLVFYDAENKQLRNILKTDIEMETFPCWAPSGDRIYYCLAPFPNYGAVPDSLVTRNIVANYKNIRYNVMSLTFDAETKTFGAPKLEVDCRAMGKSATVPRVSPDGTKLLFTLGDYGQFHIWHKSSDLYVKDLQTDSVYALAEANSDDVDSYHGWSSNGRWIVFSSRRDDGSFTRLYIAYFDKQGKAHKAFMLPQRDPEQNIMLFKSYNVPELTQNAVRISEETFRDVIYHEEGIPVQYVPRQ